MNAQLNNIENSTNQLENVNITQKVKLTTEQKINILVNSYSFDASLEQNGIESRNNKYFCHNCFVSCKDPFKHMITKRHMVNTFNFTCEICTHTAKSYK